VQRTVLFVALLSMKVTKVQSTDPKANLSNGSNSYTIIYM